VTHRAAHQRFATVKVCASLGSSLGPQLDERPELGGRLAARISKETVAICRALGSRAGVKVCTRRSADPAPFCVEIDDVVLRPSTKLLAEVIEYFRPGVMSAPPWNVPLELFADWILPHGTIAPERVSVAVDILSELASRLIMERPQCLLPHPAAATCLKGEEWEDAALRTRAFAILRRAVEFGTSAANVETAGTTLQRALEAGLEDEDATEQLIATLQPQAVRVRAHPRCLEAMVGESLAPPEAEGDGRRAEQKMRDLISFLSEGIFHELGVRMPSVRFERTDDLDPDTFAVEIGPFRRGLRRGLQSRQVLVNESPEALEAKGLPVESRLNPATMQLNAVVEGMDDGRLAATGLTSWTAAGFVILVIAEEVRRRAWLLLSRDSVEFELALLRETHPDLVSATLEAMPTTWITAVLRLLLMENVSIRNLPQILEAIIDYYDTAKRQEANPPLVGHIRECLRLVREELRWQLSLSNARTLSTEIVVYLLHPTLEERIKRHDHGEPMTNQELQQLRTAVAEEIRRIPISAALPSILTGREIRFAVRELLSEEFPWLRILSYHELAAEATIRPVSRIPNEPFGS
jgi:flagellar biosynthesis component FlhA